MQFLVLVSVGFRFMILAVLLSPDIPWLFLCNYLCNFILSFTFFSLGCLGASPRPLPSVFFIAVGIAAELSFCIASFCVGVPVHMKHLVGALEYISCWRWSESDSTLISVDGTRYSFPYTQLPLRGHYENPFLGSNSEYHLFALPAYSPGQSLFPSAAAAFAYWHSLCRVDLMLRGFRDARLHAFTLKLQANFLLVKRVFDADRHELPLLQAQWSYINRAPVPERQWSEQQKRFLDHVLWGSWFVSPAVFV